MNQRREAPLCKTHGVGGSPPPHSSPGGNPAFSSNRLTTDISRWPVTGSRPVRPPAQRDQFRRSCPRLALPKCHNHDVPQPFPHLILISAGQRLRGIDAQWNATSSAHAMCSGFRDVRPTERRRRANRDGNCPGYGRDISGRTAKLHVEAHGRAYGFRAARKGGLRAPMPIERSAPEGGQSNEAL